METMTVKEKLRDVYLDLDIRRLANHYFGKSGSWLYHKFDRVDVNGTGNPDDFSAEQLRQLRDALLDLSDRIRRAAENL